MTAAKSATFRSRLFALDLDSWDPNRTVGWAECAVDLMGQPWSMTFRQSRPCYDANSTSSEEDNERR